MPLAESKSSRGKLTRSDSQDLSDGENDPRTPYAARAPPKQSPAGKQLRAHKDGRVYFSYAQIHHCVSLLVPQIKEFKPDVMVAIGGGGFIPARMLRTELKVPILAVSLELYDDETSTARKEVKKTQWFDETSGVGKQVRGKRVLVVDEVDDTRTTLQYCVEELIRTNKPGAIAVCVVHNKIKKKKGVLPEGVTYFSGADVPDMWNCYPWDAAAYENSIYEHEAIAEACRLRTMRSAQ